MLYSKEANKKYTEMAKEFDEEFYTPNRDDNKLYKYMYLIFYMLACKGDFFGTKFEEYDKYAQYSATKVYTRYIKNERKGKKFKSVLNYCKGCKSHLKIDFQNESFISVTKLGDENVLAFKESYANTISNTFDRDELIYDTETLLSKIPSIIKEVVNDTPYANDKLMSKRLYMSCLLSLLSGVTLPNDVIKSFNKKRTNVKDNLIIKQYQKNMSESTMLWYLDEEFHDYVVMLVNKVRSILSKEINETKSSYLIPDDVVDSIISSAYDERNYANYEENTYTNY